MKFKFEGWMRIYAEPLPNFNDIFKELSLQLFHQKEKAPEFSFRGTLYGYARKAMLDVANNISAGKDREIWFPAYICDELIEIFRRHWGGALRFYDIKDDLTPNWDSIDLKVSTKDVMSIFVLVHYFGFPNSVKEAKEFCKLNKMHIIEDGAHVMPSFEGELKVIGDAVVFSLRKIFPLPNGALLITAVNGGKNKGPKVEKKIPWEWIIRVVAKRIFKWVPTTFYGLRPLKKESLSGYRKSEIYERGISWLSLKLLKKLMQESGKIFQIRQNNYRILQSFLAKQGIEPVFNLEEKKICPYAFPLRSTKRDKIIEILRRQGIGAQFWPTLPVEVLGSNSYPTARKIQSELVILPIHQDLDFKEMSLITKALRRF